MNPLTQQQRVKRLYQMLFEMATGNLSFRIQTSGMTDDLTLLENQLNSFASELQSKVRFINNTIPYYSYQSLIQDTCIIDNQGIIRNFSYNLAQTLGYAQTDLYNKNCIDILSPQSQSVWNYIQLEANSNPNYHNTIQLIFTTKDQKLAPIYCTVSRLLYTNTIIITSITTIIQDLIPSPTKKAALSEAEISQNLYDYIINHLEDPLPSTAQLSKMLNTNEYKLKEIFRNTFKTSIYQFYNDERLKRASILIQQSDFALKEIAFMCGFNDYVTFSKAFKKKYSYAPSQLNRNASNE